MNSIYLKALNQESTDVVEHPLPLNEKSSECTIRLRNLHGASAIHIILTDGQNVRLRAEIQADSDESVLVNVKRDEEDNLYLWSPVRRNIVTLPKNSRFEPAQPIRVTASHNALDVAIVVDGTCRIFSRDDQQAITSTPLLDNTEQWAVQVKQLCDFIKALTSDLGHYRIAIFAFGDERPPNVSAADLIPRYKLHPRNLDGRALKSMDLEQIESELLSIPATSGGDFVDAAADALKFCCDDLRWHAEARRLVVLIGDSPGHSVLQPVPKGGDACVRRVDVETQAMRLHRLGVELITIYHDPPADIGLYDIGFIRDFLFYARHQYARLASLPEMAFIDSTFDAAKAAEVICNQTGPIGRGPSFGEVIEILAESEM